MKISVELDIEWLSEGSTIDEQVKSDVIDKVAKQVVKGVNGDAINSLAKKAQDSIDERVSLLMDEFLSQPFQKRDRWGEPVGESIHIKDLLKNRLDTMLTDNVDSNGNITQFNGKPRYETLINKELKNTLESSRTIYQGRSSKLLKMISTNRLETE